MKIVQESEGFQMCTLTVVSFSFHQDEDLALKSSRTNVYKELNEAALLKEFTKTFIIFY